MTPGMAHFIASLSHGGWPALLPLLALFYIGANRAGALGARARANEDEGRARLATAARWASGTLFGFTGLLFLAAFFHVGCAYGKSASVTCVSNVKQLSSGLLMYSQDYDERFPPADRWAGLCGRYLGRGASRDLFRCPAADPAAGYGLNAALGTFSLAKVDEPAGTVLMFETGPAPRDFAGGQRDVAGQRHSGVSTVGFADGHAKMVWPKDLSELRWAPQGPSHR